MVLGDVRREFCGKAADSNGDETEVRYSRLYSVEQTKKGVFRQYIVEILILGRIK